MKIALTGITKSFGEKKVILTTSLTIESGSFTTLLGPSGCGKTTLLRMIAGLETPDTGEICFDDRVVFSSERKINVPPEKRGLGFVFQDFALWPHMSVFENVAFGLRAAHNTKKLDEKVRNALHAVQLDEFASRFPHQRSGGQQQRVAFARAIVIEPQCILFDEPLSALDALLYEEMRVELKELISRLGITSIFVTHDQAEAMSMSDKIAVLNGGTVEQYASPENIYSSPETQFVSGKGSRFTELKLRTPAKILGWAYIAVVLLLSVGIPYFSVISTSLIDLRSYGFRPGNFTFQHYIDLFTENEKGIRALGNSLILAVSAATICAVLGTLIVIAVRKSAQSWEKWWRSSGFFGGSPGYIFRRVTLPLIMKGVFAGWTMTFIIAFRELVAASLIAPPNTLVVSTYIVREFEQGSVSVGMAMAVLCVLFTTTALLILNGSIDRQKER